MQAATRNNEAEATRPQRDVSPGVVALGALALVGLYLAQEQHYLLFHALAEGFAIVVAFGMFMLAWNSRHLFDNGYLLFLGIAYLGVGMMDFLHMLAFEGMPVFEGGANLATQLWIGGRYLEVGALLIAPLVVGRRLRPHLTLVALVGATALIAWSIFSGVFPTCYVEAGGEQAGRLTTFKIASEYVICALLAVAAALLWYRRELFDRGVLWLVMASIVLTIAAELAFTLYNDPYEVSNLLGHYLKLVSFYLVYRAVIVTGLMRPYDVFYRQLSESETQYRRLFEHMPVGFAYHRIETDSNGRPVDYVFLQVNDAFENQTGLKAEEIVGRRATEVHPAVKDYEELLRLYGRIALHGGVQETEVYAKPLEKQFRVVVYSPRPGHFVTLSQDVTERVEAEERFRTVADFTYDMEYWIAPDGRMLYVSPSCERITGYPAEEVQRRPELLLEIVHPEDRDRVAAHLAREPDAPATHKLEFRIITRDGRTRWLGHICQPVTSPGGVFRGRRASNRDISELKQAQAELEQANEDLEQRVAERAVELHDSMERLRVALQNSSIVVGHLDTDLRFTWLYNPHPDADASRSIGKRIDEILPPEAAESYLAVQREALESGRPVRRELAAPLSDGLHYFDYNVEPLRDGDGSMVGLTVAAIDITERKQLEAQLLQAQKMESLGRLTGGIAHDFNNIIQIIVGYGDAVIRKLDEDDPNRRRVDQMVRAGRRAASLTGQLLAFGRKQVLQPRTLNLNDVVTESEKMLRTTLGADVDLRTELQPELGYVRVDPVQIEQVVLNLVVNARHAMPQGGRLTIATRNVDLKETFALDGEPVAPGHYAMLAISDTGCGMDEATRQQAFEPFFTTKPAGEGTGLGLATSYGIVRQSGGTIRIYSEPGRGTTIRIYLPREAQSAADSPEPETVAATDDASPGNATILVVEDDAPLRELVVDELTDEGFTVLAAADATEAVARSRAHGKTIDLLLTDVILPGEGGRQIAERLLAERPALQVVYMSGHTQDHIVYRGVLEPGTNFIMKPFAVAQLKTKLRDVLAAAGETASRRP